jgi:AAA domain-containing protein
MPNLSSIDYSNLYCLFKGEPGTRKSTCALSFPKPIYWFDWDQKSDALGIPASKWKVADKDVTFDFYDNWDKAKVKLEMFQVTCPYKTIVIDSITSMADSTVRQTMKWKGGSGGGKMIGTIPVGGFDEYNAESSAISELIALTKDIKTFKKVNIILIAHVIQKEQKDAAGQTHMARILVTAGKSIAQKIPAYCSEVYHFNIKTGVIVGQGEKYALFTRHMGDDFARTSLPLPQEIVFGDEPLYDKWIKPAINEMTQPPTTT